MFYSNSNNYMQDLYAYNQMPVNSTYNPYMVNTMPNAGNENMGFTNNAGMNNGIFMPSMNAINNPNMFSGNANNMNQQMNIQNPNNLYPSIYRIINPVVNRVVSGSNLPYLTEDNLNNMVDTVYNIVEGQIDLEEQIEVSTRNETVDRMGGGTTTTTTTNTPNSSSNTNTRTTTTTDTRNTANTQTLNNQSTPQTINSFNSRNARHSNRNDSLLRDLIKILILRQIFSRNWMNQMPFNYQNQFGYNPNFMTQSGFTSGF